MKNISNESGRIEGISFSSLDEFSSAEYSEKFLDLANYMELYDRVGILQIPTRPRNEQSKGQKKNRNSLYEDYIKVKWTAFENSPDEVPRIEYDIFLSGRRVAYPEPLEEDKMEHIKEEYLGRVPKKEEIEIYREGENIIWKSGDDKTMEDVKKLLESFR